MSLQLKTITAFLGITLAATTFAAPQDHAPAHGWRKKNNQEHSFQGKTKQWKNDYGVSSGVCKTENVAKVLGASAGAAIGSELSKGEDSLTQIIATVGGAALGSILGEEAAKTFNLTDAACFGQTMELTPNGSAVSWTQNNIKYLVKPISDISYQNMSCRKVELIAQNNSPKGRNGGGRNKNKPQQTIACPNGSGQWTMFQ